MCGAPTSRGSLSPAGCKSLNKIFKIKPDELTDCEIQPSVLSNDKNMKEFFSVSPYYSICFYFNFQQSKPLFVKK